MKKCLFLFFIISNYFCQAQNYQCLQSGVKHYFINGNGYLRGIRVDSVKTYIDSTVYYPFHTPRGAYNVSGFMPVLDSNGGSWLGKKVLQLNDGSFIFDSYWNDSVIIKTQANPGDSWIFYHDTSSLYYTATVSSTDTMTILSSPDSIKTIMINAYNGGGIVTSDSLNGFNIILSKNNGFVQVFDLYTFPYHKPDSVYRAGLDFFLDRSTCSYQYINGSYSFSPDANIAIFKLVDFINPNDQQLHNWNVGDIIESFHTFSNYYGPLHGLDADAAYNSYILDTITNLVISGHAVNYTSSGSHYTCSNYNDPCDLILNGGVYTFYDTVYSFADISFIPEENLSLRNYIFYFPDDSSQCILSPAYVLTSTVYNGDGTSPVSYKLGIGRTNSYDYDIEDYIWETDYLTYTNIDGIRCGTPANINNISVPPSQIQIFPNPVNEELTIRTSNTLPYTITLINMIGQDVKTIQTTKEQEIINVNNIPAGVYNVSIRDNSGNRYNDKVVIVH